MDPTTEVAEVAVVAVDDLPLSKNALKRKLKTERWDIAKKAKRVDVKARKKERREKELDAKKDQDMLEGKEPHVSVPISAEELVEIHRKRKEDKVNKERVYLENCANSFAIVIDCMWEEHHNERAIKSLAQQILFTYGLNRRSPNPAAVYLTGVGPLLKAQLDKIGMKDWVGLFICPQDYIALPGMHAQANEQTAAAAATAAGPTKFAGASKDTVAKQYRSHMEASHKELVYLSSDADETIADLDPSCAYVIGGIVDRNRLKGITHRKATEQKIRTVKLPIKDHLQLTATHVLTVNHCVELLLEKQHQGAQAGDDIDAAWKRTMEIVIPSRKVGEQKSRAARRKTNVRPSNREGDGSGDEEEEGEAEKTEGGGEGEGGHSLQ